MKIALITDTHFGGRNDSQVFDTYFAKFYENVFFPKIEELEITNIIHLGDAFDRRKYINFNTLNSCRSYFFQRIVDLNLTIDMIVGNHDAYYKNKIDVNSTRLLLEGYHDYITAIDKPQSLIYDGLEIGLIPWICKDNYEESIKFIKETTASVMFGHLELQGFGMYVGEHNEHGYPSALFDRFQLVASGHYHHRTSKDHIHYLGAPYEMTWSDYNDPKGFHIFDTETLQLEFIENPYRMFHKIYYNDVTDDVDQLLMHDYSEYTGSMIKVIIGEKSNPFAFSTLIDKLESINPADISYIDDSLDLSFEEQEFENIDDTPTLINNTITQLPQKNLHKPLKKLMGELYTEAVNLTRI